MKKTFRWLVAMQRRQLRKKEYLILLCAIPLLVLAFSLVSQKDSGILTVLLCLEDPNDACAQELVENIMGTQSAIRFMTGSKEESIKSVEAGEADCAWIFREDFEAKIKACFRQEEDSFPIVVVAQEDTVWLELARTKLFGILYPQLSFLLCEDYLEGQFLGQEVAREELLDDFLRTRVSDRLVQIVHANPSSLMENKKNNPENTIQNNLGNNPKDIKNNSENTIQNNLGNNPKDIKNNSENVSMDKNGYLRAPIRGLLLIMIVISGLLSVLFYKQDEENQKFVWIPLRSRRKLFYVSLLPSLIDTMVVALISLAICEGHVLSLREAFAFVLFLPLVATFSELFLLLCKKKEQVLTLLPILVLFLAMISPVFLDLSSLSPVLRCFSYLSPPTYVLMLEKKPMIWMGMLVYAGALFVLSTVLRKIQREPIRSAKTASLDS